MQIEQKQQQEQKQQEKAYEDLLVKNMEVLSVQNHIQGQFGVIGGSKVKDWSSPLTPPPPPPPPLPPKQEQPQPLLHKLKKQKQQHDREEELDSAIDIAKTDLTQEPKLPPLTTAGLRGRTRSRSTTPIPIGGNGRYDADVVDGGGRGQSAVNTPKQIKFQLPTAVRPSSLQQLPQRQLSQPQQREREQAQPPKRPQSAQPQPQSHYYYHNHQNFAPLRQTSTTPSPGSVGSGGHARIALSSSAASSAPAAAYSYNNNLLYCGNATMAFAAMEATADSTSADAAMLPESSLLVQTPESTTDMFIDTTAINDLSQRLQAELRTAKTRHLACTEVSIPWDLTPRIAAEIIRMSECEPCGIRGCTIFIEFEDEPSNIRRIASFKMDPNTVSTFELYLTLKQDKSGWTSLLPQFLKNLTRSSTILISPDFTLTKNKLYSGE